MAEYLLVDDRDGSVIAPLAGAEQAARILSRLDVTIQSAPPVSVVRVDRTSGISSVVAMRPLSPPVQLGR